MVWHGGLVGTAAITKPDDLKSILRRELAPKGPCLPSTHVPVMCPLRTPFPQVNNKCQKTEVARLTSSSFTAMVSYCLYSVLI